MNAPCHGDNIFDRLNATEKPNLKGEMELIGKLVWYYPHTNICSGIRSK